MKTLSVCSNESTTTADSPVAKITEKCIGGKSYLISFRNAESLKQKCDRPKLHKFQRVALH